MLKRALCLALTVLMLFSMSGCSERIAGAFMWFLVANDDDRAAKEDIFAFVSDNEDACAKLLRTTTLQRLRTMKSLRMCMLTRE